MCVYDRQDARFNRGQIHALVIDRPIDRFLRMSCHDIALKRLIERARHLLHYCYARRHYINHIKAVPIPKISCIAIQHRSMKQKTLSLRSRAHSFLFAWNGIMQFFRQEPNARLHLVSTIMVCICGFSFGVTVAETIALLIVTGMVWIAEVFNTVIESVMDFITIERNSKIAFIKDLAAGAVLLASILAAITGSIIFIPKIVDYAC
jgi:diacylglycerol kinase